MSGHPTYRALASVLCGGPNLRMSKSGTEEFFQDYNGEGRWTVETVQTRYLEYCREYGVKSPVKPIPRVHVERCSATPTLTIHLSKILRLLSCLRRTQQNRLTPDQRGYRTMPSILILNLQDGPRAKASMNEVTVDLLLRYSVVQ